MLMMSSCRCQSSTAAQLVLGPDPVLCGWVPGGCSQVLGVAAGCTQ